jgi:ABC-2 type transport system permease protein
MNKILLIAKREFRATVLSKAFLISLLTMPIGFGAAIGLPQLMQRFKSNEGKVRKIVIVDRTPGPGVQAAETLERLREQQRANGQAPSDETNGPTTGEWTPAAASPATSPEGPLSRLEFSTLRGSADATEALQMHYELGRRVAAGELAAFFDIGPAALEAQTEQRDDDAAAISYYTDKAMDRDLLLGVGTNLLAIVQLQKSASQNPLLFLRPERRYQPKEIADLLAAASKTSAVGLVQRELPSLDAAGNLVPGEKVESAFRAILPVAAALLLFFSVLIVASPQLQGVIEEKMNRIGEVLLGSATPFQVLSGKLLGMTATGLVLSLVYAGGGLLAAKYWGLAQNIGFGLPLWFLAFQALALLLFGALFIAVGSACNDMKEAQNLLMPVSIILSLPLLFLPITLEDPTGSLARWVSLIPFATPSLMVCRIAATNHLPLWEPLLGMGLVIATTMLAIWVAGRIFRIGYLSTGKAPSLVELARWIFSRV